MRVPLTQQMVEDLNAEKARTGVGAIALLRAAEAVPAGLLPSRIEVLYRGAVRSVEEEIYRFVMQAYRAMPDAVPNSKRPVKNAIGRIPLTEEMRDRLAAIWAVMPSDALEGPDAPPGLTPSIIGHLLGTQSEEGRRDLTIRRDWWAFLTAYKAGSLTEPMNVKAAPSVPLPDLLGKEIPPPRPRKPAGRIPSYAGTAYVPITEALYRHLHAEIRRTRVSPKRLLSVLDDCPKGLTARQVSSWLRGTIQSAEERYLDYLSQQYARLPDAPD